MRAARLTEHAQIRKQQRGITDLQLQLIHAFGDDRYQKEGCMLSFISRERLAQLRKAIDQLTDVAIVKSSAEKVITVMHKDRRIRTTDFVA